MRFILVCICFFFFQEYSYSQCCSPGNPIGGTTNIGTLEKKAFRLISFYRYSFSQGYWKGSTKTSGIVKRADFNYAGFVLAYGLLNKLTVETELGYFISKSQTYNVEPAFTNKGFGFNNAVLSLKYNLINQPAKSFEWSVGAGGKIPFSKKYLAVNYVDLPLDVQPSTRAFGVVGQSFLYKGFPERELRLFLINRYEYNFKDIKNYKYGNAVFNSFYVSKGIKKTNLTLIVQARYELKNLDIMNYGSNATEATISSSGSHLVFLAPQINYTIAKKWNISLLADLPVYRYYNGTQLGNKYAFAIYLSRDFGAACDPIIEE